MIYWLGGISLLLVVTAVVLTRLDRLWAILPASALPMLTCGVLAWVPDYLVRSGWRAIVAITAAEAFTGGTILTLRINRERWLHTGRPALVRSSRRTAATLVLARIRSTRPGNRSKPIA